MEYNLVFLQCCYRLFVCIDNSIYTGPSYFLIASINHTVGGRRSECPAFGTLWSTDATTSLAVSSIVPGTCSRTGTNLDSAGYVVWLNKCWIATCLFIRLIVLTLFTAAAFRYHIIPSAPLSGGITIDIELVYRRLLCAASDSRVSAPVDLTRANDALDLLANGITSWGYGEGGMSTSWV